MISVRNPSKEKARNFSYHQEISGFFVLKLTIYWSMGFIVGTKADILYLMCCDLIFFTTEANLVLLGSLASLRIISNLIAITV